jgi:hypothetical protein
MSDNLHALLAPYALDALDSGEAAAFAAHLNNCDLCAAELGGMQQTAAHLAVSVAEEPPEGLRAKVLQQAERTPQVESASPEPVVDLAAVRSRRRGANRLLAGVAAAAVIVAGVLGVSTYQANQRANDAQVAADQITALLADPDATVERTDVAGGGTGTLVVAPSSEQAAFLAASLPATGPDETYQLWAIDDAGATSVGLLQPESGRATALVDLPPGTTTFGMSVEPAGGSTAPTTEPVLLIGLAT